MKTNMNLTSFALASLIAASLIVFYGHAVADEATSAAKDAVAKVTTEAKDQEIIKTNDEAYKALREIRAARLAIFNGEPDAAGKYAEKAQKDLEVAQTSMKDYEVATKKSGKEDAYIPFDMTLSLSEGFVPSEDKHSKLNEANKHLAAGEHKKAVETLRLANIDVTVSAALIPTNASLMHVKDATRLISEKKFYEANLALKAVEDAIIFESSDIDSVPTQGGHS